MKIGILGGGQLGRMLAIDAHRLGLEPLLLDPKPGGSASHVASTLVGAWDDAEALASLARCDFVTYEFENVPAAVLARLAQEVTVRPSIDALVHTGDRLLEKQMLRALGFPTAGFRPADSEAELRDGVRALGLPAVVKTRRLGYDGRGQRVLRRPEDLDGVWDDLGGVPLLLESWVPFDREISLLAVRSAEGEIRFWAPTENTHVGGILRISRAPATGGSSAAALDRARSRVAALLEHLDYVGVIAVELFVVGESWIANEVACRVHNSGHWTLDGAVTSQFENHLRAVAGLPLGSTRCIEPSAMINLVGTCPPAADVLSIPGARLHLYGKSGAPGRKLGHVALTAPTSAERDRMVEALVARLPDPALREAAETLSEASSPSTPRTTPSGGSGLHHVDQVTDLAVGLDGMAQGS